MRKLACLPLVMVVACSGDAPTIPKLRQAPGDSPDASTPSDADFGNVDLTDPDNRPTMPPASQGGVVNDPCAFGSTIGTGIVSGVLADGNAEPALEPRVTLDRFEGALPGIFQDVTLPVPSRLELRRNGLLAISDNGFFDVDRDDTARFHLVNTASTVQVLSVDLDADGDEDAVSLSVNARAEPGGGGTADLVPFATLWEREADGRLEQRARFETRADASTLAFTTADYDGDGDPDIVTADDKGGLHALRNDGGFQLTQAAVEAGDFERSPWAKIVGLFAEDRTGDGAIDLVALVGRDQSVQARVYLNDGTGAFASAVVSELPRASAARASFGDVTGDGLSDLVMHNFRVDVARSLDAARFDVPISLIDNTSGFTLADVDADGVLDVVLFHYYGIDVVLARDALASARVSFDVAGGGLNAIAIENATDEPARLHALYHAFCSRPCDDACETRCIFEACVECVAHNDCGEGEACVDMLCVPRLPRCEPPWPANPCM